MDLATIFDIAVSVVTLLGSIATGFGAVWLMFRKRLRAWWKPYRFGIDAMADVPEIRKSVDASLNEIEQVRLSIGMLTLQIRARGDINIEAAEFERDAGGANTYVNLTYARWLGVGKSELMAWGWINFVHFDDRERVRNEWAECQLQHRVFNVRHRLVASDGEIITVDTLVTPIPEAPPAKQWIGVMRRVVT